MKPLRLIFVLVSLVAVLAGCRSKSSEANINLSNAVSPGGNATQSTPPTKEQNEARALLEQGNELFRQDQDTEAAEAYRKAISLDPDFAEAHFRLALTYAALGQRDESEEEFKKAVDAYKKYIRENEKDAYAYFNMGQAYSRLREHDDAVKAYKQAVKLQSEDGNIYYELGLSLSRLAEYKEAVIALQKAIELDPDNYRATEALEKAKEGEERIKVLQKRQEELLRKQQAAANRANVNGTSSNTSAKPAASPNP